jgi:hypothetical protein
MRDNSRIKFEELNSDTIIAIGQNIYIADNILPLTLFT